MIRDAEAALQWLISALDTHTLQFLRERPEKTLDDLMESPDQWGVETYEEHQILLKIQDSLQDRIAIIPVVIREYLREQPQMWATALAQANILQANYTTFLWTVAAKDQTLAERRERVFWVPEIEPYALDNPAYEALRKDLLRLYPLWAGPYPAVTTGFAERFPELKQVFGCYFAPNGFAHGEHCWLSDPDGNIVDPLAERFPSRGTGRYEVFEASISL